MNQDMADTGDSNTLDPETLAALDHGIKLAENGRRWTMEEAVEFARKQRKVWMKVQAEQLGA